MVVFPTQEGQEIINTVFTKINVIEYSNASSPHQKEK
jgi:hypothetical protein